jgi:hypothetical protein
MTTKFVKITKRCCLLLRKYTVSRKLLHILKGIQATMDAGTRPIPVGPDIRPVPMDSDARAVSVIGWILQTQAHDLP